MMKQNLARIFILTMIVCVICTDSFADIRLRFARGCTSATMSGSIRGNGTVCYIAGARRGQTMNATVCSRNGRVTFRMMDDTSYSTTFDFTGNHGFCLYNSRKLSSYTLTVSIR